MSMYSFTRLEGADTPVKAHYSDAGYDVTALTVAYSDERQYATKVGCQSWLRRLFCPKTIPCYVTVDTGLAIQPFLGDNREGIDTYTLAFMNSRGSKRPIILGNCVGVIDNGYTGTIKLIFKIFPWATEEDLKEYFQPGKVVGQLVVSTTKSVRWIEVGSLNQTERAEKGFGSSEKS